MGIVGASDAIAEVGAVEVDSIVVFVFDLVLVLAFFFFLELDGDDGEANVGSFCNWSKVTAFLFFTPSFFVLSCSDDISDLGKYEYGINKFVDLEFIEKEFCLDKGAISANGLAMIIPATKDKMRTNIPAPIL